MIKARYLAYPIWMTQSEYAVKPPTGKLEFARRKCFSSQAQCRHTRHSTDLKFRKQNVNTMGNTSEKFQIR